MEVAVEEEELQTYWLCPQRASDLQEANDCENAM